MQKDAFNFHIFLEMMPTLKRKCDDIGRAAIIIVQLKLNFTKQKSTSHTEQNKVISLLKQETSLPSSETVTINESSLSSSSSSSSSSSDSSTITNNIDTALPETVESQ